MAYGFLAWKHVDLSRLGYENASLQFDFKRDKSCLRITLFDDNHHQGQVVVSLEGELGVSSEISSEV